MTSNTEKPDVSNRAASDPQSYTLTIVPPGCLAPATGWRGEYFSNSTLAGLPTRCRDDASVNFDWAAAAPITGVPADNFSVRWTRTQNFTAGNYRFEVQAVNKVGASAWSLRSGRVAAR